MNKDNFIRIGKYSVIGKVIKYSLSLIENGYKDVTFSAIGDSIGKLVIVVEFLRVEIPGLHMKCNMESAELPLGRNEVRYYPQMTITLRENTFRNPNRYTHFPYDEKKRLRLYKVQRSRSDNANLDRNPRGNRKTPITGKAGLRNKRIGDWRNNRRGRVEIMNKKYRNSEDEPQKKYNNSNYENNKWKDKKFKNFNRYPDIIPCYFF